MTTRTEVLSLRIAREEAAQVRILAALRGGYRQEILLAGLRRELEAAPERPTINRLLEMERGKRDG